MIERAKLVGRRITRVLQTQSVPRPEIEDSTRSCEFYLELDGHDLLEVIETLATFRDLTLIAANECKLNELVDVDWKTTLSCVGETISDVVLNKWSDLFFVLSSGRYLFYRFLLFPPMGSILYLDNEAATTRKSDGARMELCSYWKRASGYPASTPDNR